MVALPQGLFCTSINVQLTWRLSTGVLAMSPGPRVLQLCFKKSGDWFNVHVTLVTGESRQACAQL